jgi:hypothetical protein
MKPLLTLLVLATAAAAAEAQSLPPGGARILAPDYSHEISVNADYPVALEGVKGVRSTHSFNKWLAVEAEAAGSSAYDRLVVVLNARFIGPPTDLDRMRWFGTAGIATGLGFDDTWWPMIGFGIQTDWVRNFALRAEAQLFSYDNRHVTDGRVVMGFVIGLTH